MQSCARVWLGARNFSANSPKATERRSDATHLHPSSFVFNSYDGKYIGTLHFRYGAEVSKESALIILDGIEDGKADKETQFWVVNDNKLEQIK